MSRLQGRLDRIREAFLAKAPEEAKAIMHRATEDLRASGIADGIPTVGATLAPFELPNPDGTLVRSADLLADGPLVVTFYRGFW